MIPTPRPLSLDEALAAHRSEPAAHYAARTADDAPAPARKRTCGFCGTDCPLRQVFPSQHA